MKLYFKAGACSLSPHIVLEESGLNYAAEAVDLKAKTTASGANYWQISPQGYVPALQLDSGEILTEGAAIVQYIADQAPAKKLAPANGSLERYRLQSWLNFVSSEIHKGFGAFFNPNSGEIWQAAAKANLEKRLNVVNQHLAGQAYLLGESFSVADAYLFTCLSWAPATPLDLSGLTNLTAYQARIAARPAVQAAMRAEGLLK